MSDFSKLYQLYKDQLKSEGVEDQYILSEQMLQDKGSTGIYTMLAVLYANHHLSPNLLDPEDWNVGERPDTVGIPKEVREIASRLLKRDVEREDRLILFNIRAIRHELPDNAFDKLTDILNSNDNKPNQALVDLMARKSRWKKR